MATYLELFDLSSSSAITDLRKKIRVAIAIKAQLIAASASPTATAKAWANAAFQNPQGYEGVVLNYILAANKAATTAQISGADDATVQTAVNAAVDTLLGA